MYFLCFENKYLTEFCQPSPYYITYYSQGINNCLRMNHVFFENQRHAQHQRHQPHDQAPRAKARHWFHLCRERLSFGKLLSTALVGQRLVLHRPPPIGHSSSLFWLVVVVVVVVSPSSWQQQQPQWHSAFIRTTTTTPRTTRRRNFQRQLKIHPRSRQPQTAVALAPHPTRFSMARRLDQHGQSLRQFRSVDSPRSRCAALRGRLRLESR